MERQPKYAIQLELKYCERCGGLWLRPKESELVLCPACVKATTGVLLAWPRSPSLPARSASPEVQPAPTFWGEGGEA